MKVLGIDFSLNGTGLAMYDGEDIILKKVFTTVQKDETNNPEVFIFVPKMKDTMAKIDIVAEEIIKYTEDADYILMEDHIGRYYNWMDGYGVIKYLLRKNNKDYIMASPTMIKKYAGNGKADKTMMSFFLKNDYGFDFDPLGKLANNIVDASWMAILGYQYHNIFIQKKAPIETPPRYKILKTLYEKQKKKEG